MFVCGVASGVWSTVCGVLIAGVLLIQGAPLLLALLLALLLPLHLSLLFPPLQIRASELHTIQQRAMEGADKQLVQQKEAALSQSEASRKEREQLQVKTSATLVEYSSV